MSADKTQEKDSEGKILSNKSNLVVGIRLKQLLANSNFKPYSPVSSSSKLFFNVNGEVIYATSGEGIAYYTRYYSINNDKVCVYDDRTKEIEHECIEISSLDNNRYNFIFIANSKKKNSIIYIKFSNK